LGVNLPLRSSSPPFRFKLQQASSKAATSPNGELEPNSSSEMVPLPSTSKDSSKSGLTHSLTIKLDEKNYLLWQQQVNGVITAHNLHRFILDSKIPLKFNSDADRLSDTISDEYRKWLTQDQMLFTWLLSTISDGLLPCVLGCKHAFQVWDKIHKFFTSFMKVRARQLRSELKNTKKLARSVNEYLLRIKSIVDSLTAIGDVVSKQEHIDAILEGLPEEFNAFVLMIYIKLDAPSIEDVEAILMMQEAQFEKFRQELTNPSVSANLAHTDQVPPPANPNFPNSEIGTEHYHAGRGRGRGHGRGRGATPTNRIQCQICGRMNHDAVRCWYRFDATVNPNYHPQHPPPHGYSQRNSGFHPPARPIANLAMQP
jgi:hypothetical protein